MSVATEAAALIMYRAAVLALPISDQDRLDLVALYIAGVAAERERCARVAESCDALGPDFNDSELTSEGYIARQKMRHIAAAIRAGETPFDELLASDLAAIASTPKAPLEHTDKRSRGLVFDLRNQAIGADAGPSNHWTSPELLRAAAAEIEELREALAGERDRCCAIVNILCSSDNEAQRIVGAIRGKK